MSGAEISEIIKQLTALFMAFSAIITPVGLAYAIWQNAQTKGHVVAAVAGVAEVAAQGVVTAAAVVAVDTKVEAAVAVVTAVDAKVESTVVKVEGLGKQIDGQQEKLLAAVSEAAIAKGRADVAVEQKHDQAIIDSVKAEIQKVNGVMPQPVEIVQPAENPVPVETIE